MRWRKTRGVALACAGAAALLAGCVSHGPAPVLITLPSTVPFKASAPASAASTAAQPQRLLAVRRVELPEYLVARRMRYRADASTLAEWPNTYWAERIEIGVTREFLSALRAELPGWTLCEGQCAEGTPEWTLQVDLTLVDYLRDARTLKASANITLSATGATQRVLRWPQQNYEIPAAADTPQAQAQALSDVLRRTALAAKEALSTAAP